MMQIPRRPRMDPPTPHTSARLFYERTDSDGALVYRVRLEDPDHLTRPLNYQLIVVDGVVVHSMQCAPVTVEMPTIITDIKDGAA